MKRRLRPQLHWLLPFLLVMVATVAFSPQATAALSGSIELSDEVYTTSTTCSNTAALRAAADTLDDEWQTKVAADAYEVGTIGNGLDTSPTPNPTVISYATTALTIGVSKHDIDQATAGSNANSSWGNVDIASPNDPFLSTAATLQDCSPRPATLYGTPRPAFWNATAGDAATLDAAMFEFSSPVAAFGAWFGDLETRGAGVDGEGVAGHIKLFDSTGGVLAVQPIVPTRPQPLTGDPSQRTTCGGPSNADALACGNQSTRFIGFSYSAPVVAKMLVIVGDDDSCAEMANQCSGGNAHLSFVGPQLALFDQSTIILEKDVNNTNGGTAEPADFTLSVNGAAVAQGAATPVQPGDVDIKEIQLEGYELESLNCLDQNDLVRETMSTGEAAFSLEIGLSEDLFCRFTNRDLAPQDTAPTTATPTTTTPPDTSTTTTSITRTSTGTATRTSRGPGVGRAGDNNSTSTGSGNPAAGDSTAGYPSTRISNASASLGSQLATTGAHSAWFAAFGSCLLILGLLLASFKASKHK